MPDAPLLVDALLAIARADPGAARAAATSAVELDDDSVLAPALASYLATTGDDGVYDEPSAFEGFIDGGGNPRLYERTIAALRGVHSAEQPASVVDVGCGDGRVTAATLGTATTELTLVEPSGELLASACERLQGVDVAVTTHRRGIDDLLAELDTRSDDGPRWDLAKSTYAMHTLAPDRRADVLARRARRAAHQASREFDGPAVEDRSEAHAAYAAERYELGLREYADAPDVIDGFLLPVLVGQFDPARRRHTFEQSAAAWADQLDAAGFSAITTTPVADYWWAPAVLIRATGQPGRAGR
jgi:SAM-dependent methyltransferase